MSEWLATVVQVPAAGAAGPPGTAPSPTTPPWVLWGLGLLGVGFLVFSLIRHSRRMARSRNEDSFMSDPQRAWEAMRRASTEAELASSASAGSEPRRSPLALPAPDRPSPATTPATRTETAGTDARESELRRLIAAADDRIAVLRALVDKAGSAIDPPARPSAQVEPRGPADDQTTRVYELAAAGYGEEAIARATGTPLSEVRLLLALRG